MEWRSDEGAAAWIAGFFDGEGTVNYGRSPSGARPRQLSVANTDPGLIAAYTSALDRLAIPWGIHETPPRGTHQRLYRVHVHGRPNLERFYDLVPFRSAAKRARLEACLSSYTCHYRRIENIRADLERMWIDEGLSIGAIATHFECAEGSVYRWLKKADIPRRYS